MSFEELLDQACKSAHLPEMARIQLPSALSVDTKEMLLKLSAEEAGVVLSSAIDAVNHGSIIPIDKLVANNLKDRGIKTQ
jgi:hypothetical protein